MDKELSSEKVVEKASENAIHLQMRGNGSNKINAEEKLVGMTQGFSWKSAAQKPPKAKRQEARILQRIDEQTNEYTNTIELNGRGSQDASSNKQARSYETAALIAKDEGHDD